MDLTLYEIASEYRQQVQKLAELDLPPETVADTLESLGGELTEKARNVVAFGRHLRSLAEAKRQAAKAMLESADKIEGRAADLDDYVLSCMQGAGIQKIETPWFTVSVAKNPPAVEIEDERQIPNRFYVAPPPPPPKLDKKALAAAIKAGEDIPGARLKQGVRLSVR